jgi:hypothetical protein
LARDSSKNLLADNKTDFSLIFDLNDGQFIINVELRHNILISGGTFVLDYFDPSNHKLFMKKFL